MSNSSRKAGHHSCRHQRKSKERRMRSCPLSCALSMCIHLRVVLPSREQRKGSSLLKVKSTSRAHTWERHERDDNYNRRTCKALGVAASAIRFYEEQGLVRSTRTEGGERRYRSETLRRIGFIRAAQAVGLILSEIRSAFDTLPGQRTPTKGDWECLSRTWQPLLQERIDRLIRCVSQRYVGQASRVTWRQRLQGTATNARCRFDPDSMTLRIGSASLK
jgi:redox-sensitive transcriptional activator SoxR